MLFSFWNRGTESEKNKKPKGVKKGATNKEVSPQCMGDNLIFSILSQGFISVVEFFPGENGPLIQSPEKKEKKKRLADLCSTAFIIICSADAIYLAVSCKCVRLFLTPLPSTAGGHKVGQSIQTAPKIMSSSSGPSVQQPFQSEEPVCM